MGSRRRRALGALALLLAIVLATRRASGTWPATLSRARINGLRDRVTAMFDWGFSQYMAHGYPQDELDGLACRGMGPAPSNNFTPDGDVRGGYALTLVDAMDMFALLERRDELEKAVQRVLQEVRFDSPVVVSVFEANIRVLGGLLGTATVARHRRLLAEETIQSLVDLAKNVGEVLLTALEESPRGLPYTRVRLDERRASRLDNRVNAASAGTLLLEFGVLSELTGDPRFARAAMRATEVLWAARSSLDLLGSELNVYTLQWNWPTATIGACQDSFHEYLFKTFVRLDDAQVADASHSGSSDALHALFLESHAAVQRHLRVRGGYVYYPANMHSGAFLSQNLDSLSAYYSGLLALAGHVGDAQLLHQTFAAQWAALSAVPEVYSFSSRAPVQGGYPLRPEFAEATYLLFRATRDPYYLRVGEMIVADLEATTRTACGFASRRSHLDKKPLNPRMESFFLSETLKYLYLLFDEGHWLHSIAGTHVFTTEGHLLMASSRRKSPIGRRTPNAICQRVFPNGNRSPFHDVAPAPSPDAAMDVAELVDPHRHLQDPAGHGRDPVAFAAALRVLAEADAPDGSSQSRCTIPRLARSLDLSRFRVRFRDARGASLPSPRLLGRDARGLILSSLAGLSVSLVYRTAAGSYHPFNSRQLANTTHVPAAVLVASVEDHVLGCGQTVHLAVPRGEILRVLESFEVFEWRDAASVLGGVSGGTSSSVDSAVSESTPASEVVPEPSEALETIPATEPPEELYEPVVATADIPSETPAGIPTNEAGSAAEVDVHDREDEVDVHDREDEEDEKDEIDDEDETTPENTAETKPRWELMPRESIVKRQAGVEAINVEATTRGIALRVRIRTTAGSGPLATSHHLQFQGVLAGFGVDMDGLSVDGGDQLAESARWPIALTVWPFSRKLHPPNNATDKNEWPPPPPPPDVSEGCFGDADSLYNHDIAAKAIASELAAVGPLPDGHVLRNASYSDAAGAVLVRRGSCAFIEKALAAYHHAGKRIVLVGALDEDLVLMQRLGIPATDRLPVTAVFVGYEALVTLAGMVDSLNTREQVLEVEMRETADSPISPRTAAPAAPLAPARAVGASGESDDPKDAPNPHPCLEQVYAFDNFQPKVYAFLHRAEATGEIERATFYIAPGLPIENLVLYVY